jgi:hypothetical protein
MNLTHEDLNGLLEKSASTIRDLQSQLAEKDAQLARFTRTEQAQKIASSAVERGMVGPDEANDYAAQLVDSGDDLDSLQSAVDMVAPTAPLGALKKTASEHDGEMTPEKRFEIGLLSA